MHLASEAPTRFKPEYQGIFTACVVLKGRLTTPLYYIMKTAVVTIPWVEGLHLRPAATLVHLTRRFCSEIRLYCGNAVADGQSVLGIALLGAASGAELEVHASGPDEHEAIMTLQNFFSAGGCDRTEYKGTIPLNTGFVAVMAG